MDDVCPGKVLGEAIYYFVLSRSQQQQTDISNDQIALKSVIKMT